MYSPKKYSILADKEFWIGSKMHAKGSWIWISNNKKLMPNDFFQQIITSPHYTNASLECDLHCLTIFRKNHSIPLFSPLRCREQQPFICQRGMYLLLYRKHFFPILSNDKQNFLKILNKCR